MESKIKRLDSQLPDIQDPSHWALFFVHNFLALVAGTVVTLLALTFAVVILIRVNVTSEHTFDHLSLCTSVAEEYCATVNVSEMEMPYLNTNTSIKLRLKFGSEPRSALMEGHVVSINEASQTLGDFNYHVVIKIQCESLCSDDSMSGVAYIHKGSQSLLEFLSSSDNT